MPGLGRFARGKPQATSAAPAAAPAAEAPQEAMLEDEGNWMQFDVPEMGFDNFSVNDETASFGFLDTAAHHPGEEEEEEEQQEQVLPLPADAQNPASASKGLGLSMFKGKTGNSKAATTDNAGNAVIQATSVPDATATDFHQKLDADDSESHQNTPMAKSHDSSLAFTDPPGAGDGAPNPMGDPGRAVSDSATRNAQAPATLRQQTTTQQGSETSSRSGLSLLARASTEKNVINNSNISSPTTGGIENTLEGNPPSNARRFSNFTPRATEGASTKVLPPMRASTLPASSSTSTRILPLPAKMTPPSQQPMSQGAIPRFTNRTLQGQSTPQQPRVIHQNKNLAKDSHQSQVSRPPSLQTPANSSGNKRTSLLKHAPPAVTPSPSNRSNPMGDMTTVLPPSKAPANPGRCEDTIVPPPAPTQATASSPPQDSSPNFSDLYAKFLSDIRDLEDTQNENGDRLLSMESNLAIAYSVLLRDQFQFLHLLEKLEDITKETDEAIAKYQEAT